MIHKRYYSPFENDEIVQPQRVIGPSMTSPVQKAPKSPRKFKCSTLPNKKHDNPSPLNILQQIRLDDIIIIGLIILLFFEEQEERDMPLIVGLIILLLIEFFENE